MINGVKVLIIMIILLFSLLIIQNIVMGKNNSDYTSEYVKEDLVFSDEYEVQKDRGEMGVESLDLMIDDEFILYGSNYDVEQNKMFWPDFHRHEVNLKLDEYIGKTIRIENLVTNDEYPVVSYEEKLVLKVGVNTMIVEAYDSDAEIGVIYTFNITLNNRLTDTSIDYIGLFIGGQVKIKAPFGDENPKYQGDNKLPDLPFTKDRLKVNIEVEKMATYTIKATGLGYDEANKEWLLSEGLNKLIVTVHAENCSDVEIYNFFVKKSKSK